MKTKLLLFTLALLGSIGGAASGAQSWTQLFPGGTPPAPRFDDSAVYDPATNRMIMFGGRGSSGANLNNLWVLQNANGIGSPSWTNVVPSGTSPSPRRGHQADFDAMNNRMIVFGGALGGDSPCSNEAWVLSNANGSTGSPAWSLLNPTGNAPTPRFTHSQVYDPVSNSLIVIGGEDCFSVLPLDVWVLSNANGLGGAPKWTQLFPLGTSPPPLEYASAVYDSLNNLAILFGGAPNLSNDVWILSHANGLGGTPAWTNLNVPGVKPTGRSAHIAFYNSLANVMTIFGGVSSNNALNDTWTLSNANGLGGRPSGPNWAHFHHSPQRATALADSSIQEVEH